MKTDKYIRQAGMTVYLLLAIPGVMFLVVAWFLSSTYFNNLMMNIGSGLLGGVITFLLIENLYQKRIELSQEVERRFARAVEPIERVVIMRRRIVEVYPGFLKPDLFGSSEQNALIADGFTEALLTLHSYQRSAREFLALFENSKHHDLLKLQPEINERREQIQRVLEDIGQFQFLIDRAVAFHNTYRDPIIRLAIPSEVQQVMDQVELYRAVVPAWVKERAIRKAGEVQSSDAKDDLNQQAEQTLSKITRRGT